MFIRAATSNGLKVLRRPEPHADADHVYIQSTASGNEGTAACHGQQI